MASPPRTAGLSSNHDSLCPPTETSSKSSKPNTVKTDTVKTENQQNPKPNEPKTDETEIERNSLGTWRAPKVVPHPETKSLEMGLEWTKLRFETTDRHHLLR